MAICRAESMFSPRRAGVTDSHMNALWGRRGKQNPEEKVRKRSANGLAFRRGWREAVKRKSTRTTAHRIAQQENSHPDR